MSGITVTMNSYDPDSRIEGNRPGLFAWTAPGLLIVAAIALTRHRGGWPQMWATAFGVYFACKAWVLLAAIRRGNRFRVLDIMRFVFLWAGMDPRPFSIAENTAAARPNHVEIIRARSGILKLFLGVLLLVIAPIVQSRAGDQAAAWCCMSAYVLILHFGLLHLIGGAWQRRGVCVEAIMQRPAMSTSLADFWSRRWNRAFRDVSHTLVIRPTRRLLGPAGAVGLVFVASGLVHELLMSWPARGGWGLPTAYFALEGLGIFIERSDAGRRLGLTRGWTGRAWTAVVVILPLPLLVHGPFVDRVVIPFFQAMGVMR